MGIPGWLLVLRGRNWKLEKQRRESIVVLAGNNRSMRQLGGKAGVLLCEMGGGFGVVLLG